MTPAISLAAAATLLPNQLILLDSNVQKGLDGTPTTQNAVRFIANTGIAQTVFGTPFGNTPRNTLQDAITNTANASIFKRFKFGERASFEFHATALNVFNHMNFQSVDPFIDDAGLHQPFTGFGIPSLTDSVPPGFGAAATRRVLVGGVLRF